MQSHRQRAAPGEFMSNGQSQSGGSDAWAVVDWVQKLAALPHDCAKTAQHAGRPNSPPSSSLGRNVKFLSPRNELLSPSGAVTSSSVPISKYLPP